jgi:hypothetical protein
MTGYVMLLVHLWAGVIILILAEVLGIAEELV